MPHVIVKFYPGRTDEEKEAMAEGVEQVLGATMGYDPANVSVLVEEVERDAWMEEVYEPDIVQRQAQLVRRRGYGPLAT